MKGDTAEVPYESERQGEAVCFLADASALITISEGSGEPIFEYPAV